MTPSNLKYVPTTSKATYKYLVLTYHTALYNYGNTTVETDSEKPRQATYSANYFL